MAKRVVIAIGGNAILRPKQRPEFATQLQNVQRSAEQIAKIEALDYEIVLTHGNGPQVGNILQQNELAKEVVPAFPLDACNGETQGFIGYMLEQSLKNTLRKNRSSANVATLLTEVEVDRDDPAFQNPSKPIGVFYSEEEAKQLQATKQWIMVEDAGRGYRRVVPSPMPTMIHGVDSIVHLLEQNMIVIAGGGGGIPVYRTGDGQLRGLEAVIDKDRTGRKLAEQVDADVFMILTDVSNVYLNYGQPDQQKISDISVDEAEQYLAAGHFAGGSMGPKIEAGIGFAKNGGISIICALDEADLALQGKAGTRIGSA
jgi:carbamate kinase